MPYGASVHKDGLAPAEACIWGRNGMSPIESNPKAVLSHWPADRSEPVLEQTIGDALRSAAATWGERTALVEGIPDTDQRRRWSFASLLDGAEQVARALLGRFSPGEHVAVWAANC